jgi:hypothetical protein
VRIQALECSTFHERKQGKKESVDTYAQELQRLFQRGYPSAVRGNADAQEMGQAVLSSQFVGGLVPEIKRKIAYLEGATFSGALAKGPLRRGASAGPGKYQWIPKETLWDGRQVPNGKSSTQTKLESQPWNSSQTNSQFWISRTTQSERSPLFQMPPTWSYCPELPTWEVVWPRSV